MTNDNTEFQLSHMEEKTHLLKMKSKKRHHNSSDESEDSEGSVQSSSSSDSDSDDSSISEPRHKKKRKRANSSDSDSNSDDQKRAKKRKHKKKKKKHSKKKRRSDSLEDVTDDNISISDGEISVKKKRKHKHKHSKRSRSSVSAEEQLERHGERRLMSVVKERRASSEEGSQPSRTYYQKEYHSAAATKDYQSEHDAQKYYKVSGREQHVYQDYNYTRERNERYATHDDNRQREKFGHSSHNEEYSGRPREYNEFKRPSKYGESRPEELYKKDREGPYVHKEDPRGNPRYPQRYEERPQKRREFDDSRDYRERRGPPEPDRYREKQYDKRERYNEERYSPERGREIRRDRPARPVKPPTPVPQQREESRSRSSEERYREKKRERDEREPERYRQDERRDRRTDERPDGRRTGRQDKPEPRNRERKTRFDNANDEKEYSWGKTEVKKEGDKNPGDKEKPNFGLSGKLTADANTVNGVIIKYTEPDDAKQPKRRWRFYPFKGDKALPILYIHRQSCFLIGRDKKVVDIALEHPSISKQHAALQYRATPFTRQDGSQGRRVRPYVIDLESANGTFVNNKKVEARRYVELLERDVVKFGFSAREYVLLHENSKDEAQDDDQEPAPTTGEGLRRDKHEREAAAADGE